MTQDEGTTATENGGPGPEAVARQDGVVPLWTAKQAAAYLAKSERWLCYALRIPPGEPGSIPHARIGRNVRFDGDELREWVRDGCPPAATFKAWRGSGKRKTRKGLDFRNDVK